MVANNFYMEVSNRSLPPHVQRLITERDELTEKTSKLGDFLHTEMYKSLLFAEQIDLQLQHMLMQNYLTVLLRRIRRSAESPVTSS